MKYLEYEVTKLPNSVEDLFCRPLDEGGERIGLNEIQIKIITLAMVSSKDKTDHMYEKLKKEHNLSLILEDRLKSINCKTDNGVKILITCCCKSPGEAVMYTYYLAYKMKELGIEFLDTEALCLKIFPKGFFSSATLEKYWNKQKVDMRGKKGGDNLLDYTKATESLVK
jgi:hypothetical protein